MSIETLLEAAKFLELQAQQQKARGKLVFYYEYIFLLTFSCKIGHTKYTK